MDLNPWKEGTGNERAGICEYHETLYLNTYKQAEISYKFFNDNLANIKKKKKTWEGINDILSQ